MAAEQKFFDMVWYNRHQCLLERNKTFNEKHPSWKGAKVAEKRIEKKYGKENLIFDDFEWGMVSGKLSAIRWVLGEDWDVLDT